MPSHFDCLPGDVLQHEINKFILPLERVVLNQAVLQSFPGERVYAKFPSDYAMLHHMLVVKTVYNSITMSINNILNSSPDKTEDYKEMHYYRPLLKFYEKLFRLLKNPVNRCIFKYDKYARKMVKETIMSCYSLGDEEDGNDIYIGFNLYLYEFKESPILMWAKEVLDIIEATPFERHIKSSKKSIYRQT
jgi:hypothetical protein